MPLDSMFLGALKDELLKELTDAKIEKIQQPGKGTFVFSVRGKNAFKLLLSAEAGSARVNVTEGGYDNPQEPPMFCMLLRKHLIGARIVSVSQPDFERALIFDLEAPGIFREGEERKLIMELSGHYSNMILTDGDGIITDCLYRVGSAETKRAVLPGLKYVLPPLQKKISPLSEEGTLQIAPETDGSAARFILNTFGGISPLISREIVWRAYGDTDITIMEARAADGLRALSDEWEKYKTLIASKAFKPYLIKSPDGRPFDFSYMPILQYGSRYELTEEKSFSELLDLFYSERDAENRKKQLTSSLTRSVRKKRDRVAKRIAAQKEELLLTAKRDTLRENGDIITSNLHLMKKGMSVLRAYDFYSEDGGEREIALDPLKTPQQNAAKYYKDYTRAKNAEKHLTEQIKNGEEELDYLESVLDELSRTDNDRELDEIKLELSGYIQRAEKGKKEKRVKDTGFMCFVSSTGVGFAAGKNNIQNEKLTLRSSGKNDIWLHAQKVHGSHVIIPGGADETSLAEAAKVAAYYSEARESSNVPVDYTLVRYVKKPQGARPGMVIYTNYKTLFVTPDKALAEKLRIK